MSVYDKTGSGKLDNSNVASIMIDMYRSVNKKFSPSKYDIETYSKILDNNQDGRINQTDLENLIRKYLAVNVDVTRTTTTSIITTSTTNVSKKKDLDFDEMRRTFDNDDLD
jgi:Ca2+-binding EF-hand superfamily protein